MKKLLSALLCAAVTICSAALPSLPVSAADFSIKSCYGWNEYAYVLYNGTLASAAYKKASDTAYTAVDTELIRNSEGRVDIPGLAKNTAYNIRLTASDGSQSICTVNTKSNDRSGYAFFNYGNSIGAYNDDGTLKSNADVIYVTNETKNTVKYGNYTGIGNILVNSSKLSKPLDVRIIGTIDSQTRDADGTKATDKANGVVQINGLTDKVKTDDSYFNMLDVKNTNIGGLTIEGIGDDAVIEKWGFMFYSCENVEIRNLTFTRYPEDACSTDKSKRFWLHNCTFEKGENKYDLTEEQDKHEGDGSSDMNGSSYITLSYNKYTNTHKTSLNGGSDSVKSYNYTYHHNFFNGCSSRLPLTRQVNLHMYNNYFYKCGTCIDARASAWVLSEANYFEDDSVCYKTSTNTKGYGSPVIKSVNDFLTTSSKYTKTDLMHLNVARDYQITESANLNASPNFDTNSSKFYYSNNKSDVELLQSAELAKEESAAFAGVLADSKADNGNIGSIEPPVTTASTTTEATTELPTESTSAEYTETTTVSGDSLVVKPSSKGYSFTSYSGKANTNTALGGAVANYNTSSNYVEYNSNGVFLYDSSSTVRTEYTMPLPKGYSGGKLTITGTVKPSTASSSWALIKVMNDDDEVCNLGTNKNSMLTLTTNTSSDESTTKIVKNKLYNYSITLDFDTNTITASLNDTAFSAAADITFVDSLMALTSITGSRNLTLGDITISHIELGDVDDNGKIDKLDASIVLKHISNISVNNDFDFLKRADMDSSGIIDMTDVIAIFKSII